MVPISFSKLKNSAGMIVAAFKASIGERPASTNNCSSLCKLYPGVKNPIGVSVPAIIFTLCLLNKLTNLPYLDDRSDYDLRLQSQCLVGYQ